MRRIIFYLLAAAVLLVFFSYRLVQVPAGITGDEAAFGYNGILLSQTLHDENGRFLPVFVLSLGGDWRQPVTQYFTTVIFKIFGPSVFNLRMTSVITAVVSILLIYFLAKKLLGNIGGVVAAIFMATTPIFMIQSHLGLDNITPIPFVIGWLLGLYFYSKTKRKLWLTLSAVCLGIGFYSYKAMRIFVPAWFVLSTIYLAESFLRKRTKKEFISILKPILVFSVSIFPFFAVIPRLEFLYAGAVLNKEHLAFEGFYKFFYPYLSTFDPSFLFVKGDELLFHSTGRHGMYLLMSLPFFIPGLAYSWKKGSFWKLIIASFFLGPLLFGFMGEVHRASRLLAEIPLYALISGAGFLALWEKKQKLFPIILIAIFAVNYFDFLHYYLGQYAADTQVLFNCFSCKEEAYKILSNESQKRGLVPYIDNVISEKGDTVANFARTIYFLDPLSRWNGKKESFPKNGILMTDNDNVTFLTKITQYGSYYFYIK